MLVCANCQLVSISQRRYCRLVMFLVIGSLWVFGLYFKVFKINVVLTIYLAFYQTRWESEFEKDGLLVKEKLHNVYFLWMGFLQIYKHLFWDIPICYGLIQRLLKDHLARFCPNLQQIRLVFVFFHDFWANNFYKDWAKVSILLVHAAGHDPVQAVEGYLVGDLFHKILCRLALVF